MRTGNGGSQKGTEIHTTRLLYHARSMFSSGQDGKWSAWVAVDSSRTARSGRDASFEGGRNLEALIQRSQASSGASRYLRPRP